MADKDNKGLDVVHLAWDADESRTVREHAEKLATPERGINRMRVTQDAGEARRLLRDNGRGPSVLVCDNLAWIGTRHVSTAALKRMVDKAGGYVVAYSRWQRDDSSTFHHYASYNPFKLPDIDEFYDRVLAPVVALASEEKPEAGQLF